jgi:hypothetical protein
MDWTEDLMGPGAIQNPTRSDVSGFTTAGAWSGPQADGGTYAPRSGGSGKGDIFYGAKWQLSANALLQLPWGTELAGSLYGRQGYPRPIIISRSAGGDGTVRTMATSMTALDDNRYPSLWNLDLRLAKNVRIAGNTNMQFAADLFNVLDVWV